MSVFRFKQFEVDNTASAMKVGTDSVLLGASVDLSSFPSRILDIGTGTGVVSLMIAQRLAGADFAIDAIDIDAPSVSEAAGNFARSPWGEHLAAYHSSLRDWEMSRVGLKYDLIVSNPPFFDNSLPNPDERVAVARHTATLSYREILAYAACSMTSNGKVVMILPIEDEKSLLRYAASFSLYSQSIVRVRTTARKSPRRLIAEFGRLKTDTQVRELTMQEDGGFTSEYSALVSAFLLFL